MGDQSFPERIPDYLPTEGKDQKRGGSCKEKKKNQEAALYIIAHYIIYKKTRNNSGGCLSTMCQRTGLCRRLQTCISRHKCIKPTRVAVIHLNIVDAYM